MAYRLGVDLGTTYTAAAVLADGAPAARRCWRSATARLQVPSVLFVREDGEVLVGEAAERRGVTRAGTRRSASSSAGSATRCRSSVGGTPYSAAGARSRSCCAGWWTSRPSAQRRAAGARHGDATRRTGGRSSGTCWRRPSRWPTSPTVRPVHRAGGRGDHVRVGATASATGERGRGLRPRRRHVRRGRAGAQGAAAFDAARRPGGHRAPRRHRLRRGGVPARRWRRSAAAPGPR